LCRFAVFLAESISWGTIRSYISALRFYQISVGLPDPSIAFFPWLTYLLNGIRKHSPDHVRSRRLPITPDMLRSVHTVWSQGSMTFNKVMLWAACCLGFFGFMRAGEFTRSSAQTPPDHLLMVGDITVDSRSNPQMLVVLLRHSKTDPFSAGIRLCLGRTGNILCPVSAVLGYLAIRPPNAGPLFLFEDGTPLSRAHLVTHLREALLQAGIDTNGYSGHGFRIGAASTAARAGFRDSFIQTLGHWKSSAFTAYIRTPPEDLLPVAARLSNIP